MAKHTKWIDAACDEAVVAVAVRGLRSRFAAVVDYVTLAATRPDEDPEYVHQMRVWSRRGVAALGVFRPLLPKRRRRWLKAQLKWIRRASNDARDDDVFAMRLAADCEHPEASRLLKAVRKHRKKAQRPIIEAYRLLIESGLFERRGAKLLERVRPRGKHSDLDGAAFGPWAGARIQPLVRRFFDAADADLDDVAALHQFRICAKKLRYAIELLAPAFPESLRTEAYPMIQALQDRLGEINDHATACQRLERWIDQADDPEEEAYLRAVLDVERHQCDASRDQFFAWWNAKHKLELCEALAGIHCPAAP